MTRPMSEDLEAVDIAHAIVSAEETTPGVVIPRCQKNLLILARALLSTSASERGMRAALERIAGGHGYDEVENDPWSFAAALQKTAAEALAALTSKGEGGI